MTIQPIIEEKLHADYTPTFLEVINESDNHSGPAGRESHFKVVIVSDSFEGLRPLQRHRKVNATLSDELANYIHALAIHTYSENEWAKLCLDNSDINVPASPDCQGGSK